MHSFICRNSFYFPQVQRVNLKECRNQWCPVIILKVGIIIYSIVRILTIVFPGSRNVKYLPIFHGSFNSLVISHSSRHAQSFHISNTDFFIQISKMSIVSISSII